MISHCNRRHSELCGSLEQRVEQRVAVEHRVLRVHVQVHEGRVTRHRKKASSARSWGEGHQPSRGAPTHRTDRQRKFGRTAPTPVDLVTWTEHARTARRRPSRPSTSTSRRHCIDVEQRLVEMRRIIRAAAPDTEETISYNIPAYKSDGVVVVQFAGFTEHTSLNFFPTAGAFATFADELRAVQDQQVGDPLPARRAAAGRPDRRDRTFPRRRGGRLRRQQEVVAARPAGSCSGSCRGAGWPSARSRAHGSVTMRRWSGSGQLKPVPWVSRIFSCSSRSRASCWSSLIGWTSGSSRGKTYNAPRGTTTLTPGILRSSVTAVSRCSSSRPPGRISSLIDWYPPSATWIAFCAGTLGHSRIEASSVMPSR